MIKQFTEKEILDKIPGSWEEVTLDFYLNKLLKARTKGDTSDPIVALENSIELASMFVDVPVDLLSKFPIHTINEIHKKLSFVAQKPKPIKNPKYKWITKMEEPDFDTYIAYIKVSNQLSEGNFELFPMIVKLICKNELTDEQVMNMPMSEIETGFFLLRKSLRAYLRPIIHLSTAKMMNEEIKKRIQQRILTRWLRI